MPPVGRNEMLFNLGYAHGAGWLVGLNKDRVWGEEASASRQCWGEAVGGRAGVTEARSGKGPPDW